MKNITTQALIATLIAGFAVTSVDAAPLAAGDKIGIDLGPTTIRISVTDTNTSSNPILNGVLIEAFIDTTPPELGTTFFAVLLGLGVVDANLSATYAANTTYTLTFTHPQGTLASDLSAAYQWSTDLATFSTTTEADLTTVTAEVTGTIPARLSVRVAVTPN